MRTPARLPTADARRWLGGLALVTACSWGRWFATGSLKIDESYPTELAGTALLFLLGIGWALAVWGWSGFLARPPLRPRRLALVGLLVASPMLPLLSNDLFSLFSQAELTLRGKDVFTSASAFPESVWFSWLGTRWRANPSPYGPAALIATWPSALGGSNPWLGLLALKLSWLLPTAAVTELSLRSLRRRPMFHAMVWLNPLFLVEGVGQLHIDVIGMLAIVVGLLLDRGLAPRAPGFWKQLAAASAWAFAALTKWTSVVTVPWFWLAHTRTWEERWRRGVLLGITVLTLGTAFYAPFWRGIATLTKPVEAMAANTLVPGGGVVDVVGTAVNALRGAQGDHFDPAMPVPQRVTEQRAARGWIWAMVQRLMELLALVAVAPVLLRLWRGTDERQLALATGLIAMVVLTLASPKFQSWYLLAALPFFGLSCPAIWRRWWVWAVAFGVSEEFALCLPRDATLFAPLVVVSTTATALVFLWGLRARFWGLDWERPPGPLPRAEPAQTERRTG